MSAYADYLKHHGIKGQKWGVKNGHPYPIGAKIKQGFAETNDTFKALYETKSANLEKWGKDKDHNVLYLSGLSGSGKSTLAKQIGERLDADVIHLDFYFNKMSQSSRNEHQSKEFNRFLEKHVPNWKDIPKADSAKNMDWKTVDKFAKAIEQYGRDQYKKRKVVVEGVQLMDSTLYADRSFYKDKPYAMMTTSVFRSWIRGNIRDEMNGLDFFYRIPNYIKTSKIKSQAIRDLSLKGKQYIYA